MAQFIIKLMGEDPFEVSQEDFDVLQGKVGLVKLKGCRRIINTSMIVQITEKGIYFPPLPKPKESDEEYQKRIDIENKERQEVQELFLKNPDKTFIVHNGKTWHV